MAPLRPHAPPPRAQEDQVVNSDQVSAVKGSTHARKSWLQSSATGLRPRPKPRPRPLLQQGRLFQMLMPLWGSLLAPIRRP